MVYRCVFLIILLASATLAQEINQGQSRLIFHEVKELGRHWSLRGWLIGNVSAHKSSNLNLLGGVGYQQQNWWLEAMVQRQWYNNGGQWFADFRAFMKPASQWAVYLEAAPFLDKNRWYTTAFVERALGKGFAAGLETENVNGAGADAKALGIRASKALPAYGRWQPEIAVSWYAWSNQPRILRLYVVVHRRDRR